MCGSSGPRVHQPGCKRRRPHVHQGRTTHNNTQQHTTTHNNTQQHTTTHNNTQHTTHNTQHTTHNNQHTTHNTQHTTTNNQQPTTHNNPQVSWTEGALRRNCRLKCRNIPHNSSFYLSTSSCVSVCFQLASRRTCTHAPTVIMRVLDLWLKTLWKSAQNTSHLS